MKNLKLLLATTAILSSAYALNVKAEEPETAIMNVKATIINVLGFTILQDVDFGHMESTGVIEVEMNPKTGHVAGSQNSLSPTQNGILILTSYESAPKTISLPSSVTLKNNAGSELSFIPQFDVIEEFNPERGGAVLKDITYGIGGSLRNNQAQTTDSGVYTGELTITAVVDTGA